MVKTGPAKRLAIYADDADKFVGQPFYEVLPDIYFKKKMAGVSVFRGVAGMAATGFFTSQNCLNFQHHCLSKLRQSIHQ